MKFLPTALKDVILIQPDVYGDQRGYFYETYHQQKYATQGIGGPFVQDNYSRSVRDTLRGLHYQLGRPQGKLVTVLEGCVYDVAVDIRKGSPTFGKWVAVELSAENKQQLYIPPGFAHGFCVLSEAAAFLYKCTDVYVPAEERGIHWNDPVLGISWPCTAPLLSAKDVSYTTLSEMSDALPLYRP